MADGNGLLTKEIALWLVRVVTAFLGAAGLWGWTHVNRQLGDLHDQVSVLQQVQATQAQKLSNIEDDLDMITRRERTRR